MVMSEQIARVRWAWRIGYHSTLEKTGNGSIFTSPLDPFKAMRCMTYPLLKSGVEPRSATLAANLLGDAVGQRQL
jgi:hypothetical protein